MPYDFNDMEAIDTLIHAKKRLARDRSEELSNRHIEGNYILRRAIEHLRKTGRWTRIFAMETE